MRSFKRLNGITRTMPCRSFEPTESLNHLDCRMWHCRNLRLTPANLVQHYPIATANRTRGHDGCVYATAKALGFDIDYKRLLAEFQSRGTLVRAYYYTAVVEDQEFSSIRPLVDWLDYNGCTVVTKSTKTFVDASGRRKLKGNMVSSLLSTRWSSLATSIRWHFFPVMEISGHWSRLRSVTACG
jgi:hypothetical protein